jgi:hypothetical protein
MAGYQAVRRTGEPAAACKPLLEPGTGRVHGRALAGPQAEEVVNLFAPAARLRLPARELGRMLSAAPTAGRTSAACWGEGRHGGAVDGRQQEPATGIVGLGRTNGGLALNALSERTRVAGHPIRRDAEMPVRHDRHRISGQGRRGSSCTIVLRAPSRSRRRMALCPRLAAPALHRAGPHGIGRARGRPRARGAPVRGSGRSSA